MCICVCASVCVCLCVCGCLGVFVWYWLWGVNHESHGSRHGNPRTCGRVRRAIRSLHVLTHTLGSERAAKGLLSFSAIGFAPEGDYGQMVV